MLGRLIFLGFAALALIEIALFIVIGQTIGVWPTLAGIVLISVIGAAIIRRQGLGLLAEIRTSFGQGQLPARAVADAMLVAIAGVLMVVPGYLTDLLGLLLLIPPVRLAIYVLLAHRLLTGSAATAATFRASAGQPDTIDLDRNQFRPR